MIYQISKWRSLKWHIGWKSQSWFPCKKMSRFNFISNHWLFLLLDKQTNKQTKNSFDWKKATEIFVAFFEDEALIGKLYRRRLWRSFSLDFGACCFEFIWILFCSDEIGFQKLLKKPQPTLSQTSSTNLNKKRKFL